MPYRSFAAPFYGKIKSLTVDPHDNSLWIISTHPNGRSIAPTQVNVSELLDRKQPNESIHTHDFSGVAVTAFGHHTGLYVASAAGKLYRFAAGQFSLCHDFGESFGLQGISDFRDGRQSYPRTNGEGKAIEQVNRKLLVVGSSTAIVVDVAADGAFLIAKELLAVAPGNGTITAWAAETVFSVEAQSHHCAFGLSTGGISLFFTAQDDNEFEPAKLYNAAEVELVGSMTLHERAVNSLVYVREVDRYGKEKRYLVSTGADQKNYQISMLENIAISRMPSRGHSMQIRAFVPGAFADGDGARRGESFARFYSLSDDLTIKAWLNEYTTEPLSSAKVDGKLAAGCIMVIPVIHESGNYAKGEFMGKAIPTPHLVVGGGETVDFIPIVKYDKGHTEEIEDLRKNGRLSGVPLMSLVGGLPYVTKFGIEHESAKVRAKSLQRFQSWQALWLIDQLRNIAVNKNFPFEYREAAINALVASSQPRKVVALEGLLSRWGNTENTQELAYNALNDLFTDSLRAQQVALKKASDNIVLHAIDDLADFARGNGPLSREARQMLQSLISHRTFDVAKRAYDQLSGEGFEPVMPGVDGVLYGIFSSRADIRREMGVRLASRDLVDSFETTIILRRLLESSDEAIRERASDVSLLRAPSVATILRAADKFLHQRLYVLTEGALGSDSEEREAKLASALPSAAQVASAKALFAKEDPSIQSDLDVLVEFSSCSKDDVSVYALQTKAALGYESAVQGLLQLSNSKNEKVMRQATVGLGYMVHLDDSFQRLCGITLSKKTPEKVGLIAIFYAIKGYEHRQEDPVQNLLKKVLDGGKGELRKTAVTIAQGRLHQRLMRISQQKNAKKSDKKEATEGSTSLFAQLQEAQQSLQFARKTNNSFLLKASEERIAEIEAAMGSKPSPEVEVSSEMRALLYERDLLRVALKDSGLDYRTRKEAYKTFVTHNLEDSSLSDDKTPTLKMLLNLREQQLVQEALTDLLSHLGNPQSQSWALQLVTDLINQKFIPDHHSNAWSIWTQIADDAEGKSYEGKIIHIGFNCSSPDQGRKDKNGSHEVGLRYRIRRDAFLRALRASGDWLADLIREALAGKENGSMGVSVTAVALGEQGKEAIGRLDDPEDFIHSLLEGANDYSNIGYACELLLTYPRYYSERIKALFYKLRSNNHVIEVVKSNLRFMTKKLYQHFFQAIKNGRTEYCFQTIESYASQNGESEDLANMLMGTDDTRAQSRALLLARQHYDVWGKALLEQSLHADDPFMSKRSFTIIWEYLNRQALKKRNDDELRTFGEKYFSSASVSRQIWVLDVLSVTKDTPDWALELLRQSCGSEVEELRLKAYNVLNDASEKGPWIIEVLKKGLRDANSTIVEMSFQALLAVNKMLGSNEEKEFLTKAMRESDFARERSIATALKTTASWRVQFILQAINDEDDMIRKLMCEKLRSVSGLADEFYQDLLEHKAEEVRQLARNVLSARGLYRAKVQKPSGSLETIILEDPPAKPQDWVGWIDWYWRVQAWKSRKIDAIRAAGKTHDADYYEVFKSLLSQLGYGEKISSLWSDAVRVSSWSAQDWCQLVILETGWVVDASTISYVKSEASKQRDNRYRVAWNVAASRYGDKSCLKWLVDKFYDTSWRNYHRRYIKKQYLFEGLFSVDSFVGFSAKREGPAFALLQRLLNDDRSLTNDLFRLAMLRLSKQGGPVDLIGIGYTCSDDKTVLESVAMRECQDDKEKLFAAVVGLLNASPTAAKDAYELADAGGNWYDVVRLTLELNTQSFEQTTGLAPVYWRHLADLMSCQHAQLRARAVGCYFRRSVHGEEKERFQADIENFARQLSSTTVDSFELTQDGQAIDPNKTVNLAIDAYIGLIRKAKFSEQYRREAVQNLVALCSRIEDVDRAVPILTTGVTLEKATIRFEAYHQLLALQAKNNDVIRLEQLLQLGLRSPDARLKKSAVSFIWCTDQLTAQQKRSKLQVILRNVSDVAAQYAFELLYALAGRPKAWDQADVDLETGKAAAKKRNTDTLAQIDAQIKQHKEAYSSFEKAFYKSPSNQRDSTALGNRRTSMNEQVAQLGVQRREANSRYAQEIESLTASHKASMTAPLSDEDKQTWAAAVARRDAVIEMALGSYYPTLRTKAIDQGLTELARRRSYFEKEAEEFTGYFHRLLAIIEQGLHSPYSKLVRHTAVNMAAKGFVSAYPVLLEYLNSHDASLQVDGINGLVNLGGTALTQFKDANGEPYPRTAIVLLNRAEQDEFGTVNRYQIFQAVAKLKDSHSSVVEALFAYLQKGPENADYRNVLTALINIAGCRNQIATGVRWADLSPADLAKIQPHLSRQLDWEQVSLDAFAGFYDIVYDETLLARIIEDLLLRSDYQSISSYGLLRQAQNTKGFDIRRSLNAGKATAQPIDSVLRSIALLPINDMTQYIRSQAVNALIYRLKNRQCWVLDAQRIADADSVLLSALKEVVETTKEEVTNELISLVCALAYAGQQSLTSTVYNTLYTVSTGVSQPVNWRLRCMEALGHLSDERAVVALLHAAGYDEYGEQLPVDPDLPKTSSRDKDKLAVAAAKGLGGMIFAQEREAIFQLLNGMTRSNDQNVRQKGFAGLRYFSRSEQYALPVTAILAARLQAAVNGNQRGDIQFFLGLFAKLLEPVADEDSQRSDARTAALLITQETEEQIQEYALKTLFGQVFEIDGEAYQPLDIESSLFKYKHSATLESAYQVVRQWVHGPHQVANQSVDSSENTSVPIDFSYLAEWAPKQRTVALQAERLLFENSVATKYSQLATKALATYASDAELFDLIAYAEEHDFEQSGSATKERYLILFNGLIHRQPSPIKEAFGRLRKDYTCKINDELPDNLSTELVLALFRTNIDSLSEHLDQFVEVLQWLHSQLIAYTDKRKQGDKSKSKHREYFFSILWRLVQIAQQLPPHKAIVDIAASLMSVTHLVEDLDYPQQTYCDIFNVYMSLEQVDWSFVSSQIAHAPRAIRGVLANRITPSLIGDMTSDVLRWLLTDQAAIVHLADALHSSKNALQEEVVSRLKDSGTPAGVLLLLARLNSVAAFRSLIDAYRDEGGNISDEVGLRSRTASRSNENTYAPLTVDTLLRGVSMIATEDAENYLRDISEDERLAFGIRQVALKAAKTAYRRRVPLHVRRQRR